MFVQPFVTYRSVEALDIRVVLWLARLNKQQSYATFVCPGVELGTDVLGPVI